MIRVGHVKFDCTDDAPIEGRNKMLLTLVITPLALGLIVVIMAAVKKLRPQPAVEEIRAEQGRKRLKAAIQSKAEKEKVSLKT
jgi:hypothetical protein